MWEIILKAFLYCWFSIALPLSVLLCLSFSVISKLFRSPGPGRSRAQKTETEQKEVVITAMQKTKKYTWSRKKSILTETSLELLPTAISQAAAANAVLYWMALNLMNVTGWITARYCSIHVHIWIRGLKVQLRPIRKVDTLLLTVVEYLKSMKSPMHWMQRNQLQYSDVQWKHHVWFKVAE